MNKIYKSIKFLVIAVLFAFFVLPKAVGALSVSITEISNEGFSVDVVTGYDNNGNPVVNLKLNTPSSNTKYQYYAYFTKGSNEAKPDLKKFMTNGNINYSSSLGKINIVTSSLIAVDNDWYIANGYEYLYIIRFSSTSDKYLYEITSRPIQVSKPDLPILKDRYSVSAYPEFKKIVINPNFPYVGGLSNASYGDHKFAVKVAMLTDENVFTKFQNGATDSYDSLLNFAKQSNVKVYTVADSSAEIDLSDLDIVENGIYFVYTTYLNENGLYRQIDGINILMGKDGFLTEQIDWQNAVYKKQSDSTGLLIFAGIAAAIIIILIIYVKAKDRKEEIKAKKHKEEFMSNFINSVNDPNRQSMNRTNNTPPPPPPQPPQNNNYNNGMNNYPNNYNNQNGYGNQNNYNNYNNYNNQNNNRY